MATMDELYNRCIAERVGCNDEQVAEWCKNTTIFTCSEALNRRLADGVVRGK